VIIHFNFNRHCDAKERKEGSRPISRILSWTVIPLGRPSPISSSNLPASSAGHAIGRLFGLAPGGVCRAVDCCQRRGALLPHHFTLTCGGIRPCCQAWTYHIGGIFLLHFPSARTVQALPGTLPYGVRTFLQHLAAPATVWPTPGGDLTGKHCTAAEIRIFVFGEKTSGTDKRIRSSCEKIGAS